MVFPSWFQQAIQRRLDHVAAHLESNLELKKYREEERIAYQAMVIDISDISNQAFLEWEDKAHLARAMDNERMYLQGMRDGAQLVMALLTDPLPSDESLTTSKKSVSGKTKD